MSFFTETCFRQTFFSVSSVISSISQKQSFRRRRRRNTPPQDQNPDDDNNMLAEFMDENHGPLIDHPIWYITTVGLEQAIINAISVCKYKKGEGLVEGTDCSVCLSEFDEGETLRLLPKCSHAFHLPCIDTWLRNHKNCPLCRAPIVSNPAVGVSNAIVPILEEELDVVEETRIEIPEIGSGVETGEREDSVVSEARIGIEDEIELQEVRRDIDLVKEGEDSAVPNSEIRVVSDLGENQGPLENAIQPVRRSVSMDFSSMFCFSMGNSFRVELEVSPELQPVRSKDSELAIVPKNKSSNPSVLGLIGSSSKGRSLQTGPVSMKRSFSSGAKLFIPRYNHNRSSILPL
ncbi:hypothetical protein C5167_039886 [Papaver somniferum]|uniref:RING-type E3 ubiquitin transferase n=1 Tax=Papaver somniferum TaxID=3469 RepID=A0A4Y7IDF5_PAPSO|nr:RING-H2 finger protein ATL54-like isoform X2 [Papaver somniferum]RZC46943.1 hypothetical protein C5167_039886 [Papaver somniferum]